MTAPAPAAAADNVIRGYSPDGYPLDDAGQPVPWEKAHPRKLAGIRTPAGFIPPPADPVANKKPQIPAKQSPVAAPVQAVASADLPPGTPVAPLAAPAASYTYLETQAPPASPAAYAARCPAPVEAPPMSPEAAALVRLAGGKSRVCFHLSGGSFFFEVVSVLKGSLGFQLLFSTSSGSVFIPAAGEALTLEFEGTRYKVAAPGLVVDIPGTSLSLLTLIKYEV